MKYLKLFTLFSFSVLLISCSQNKEPASDVGLFGDNSNAANGSATNSSTNDGSGSNLGSGDSSGASGSSGSSGSGGNSNAGGGSSTTTPAPQKLDFNRAFTIVEDYGNGLEGNYANIQEFTDAANAGTFTSCIYARRQGDTTGTSNTYVYLGFGPCLTILFTQN